MWIAVVVVVAIAVTVAVIVDVDVVDIQHLYNIFNVYKLNVCSYL